MSALICEKRNFTVLSRYSSFIIQRALINANKCSYNRIKRQSISDALLYNTKEFLTNEKFSSYTNTNMEYSVYKSPMTILGFTISFASSIKILFEKYSPIKFVSDKLTQFGHYITKEFYGIECDETDNHLIDLVNASFMMMNNNPSLANSAIQAAFLLSRIYKEDIPIVVDQEQQGKVSTYDL